MAKEAGAEPISDQLEAAINEEVEETESPPVKSESEDNETSPEAKGKAAKTVPYSRFVEVNESKKAVQEQFTELEQQYKDASSSLTELTKLVADAKDDRDLLAEIKALANDPAMLPHIEAIDKKLKGEEVEDVEDTDEKDGNKILTATRKVLEKQQAELREEHDELRSSFLTQRADAIADKWLETLPEQYTDQDKEIVSELWAGRMDDEWNALEGSPENLQDVLADTFQKTIDAFGPPRGGLVDPTDPDSYEVVQEETPETSPEEELRALTTGKDYGKVVEGKFDISDDDFIRDFAEAKRISDRS